MSEVEIFSDKSVLVRAEAERIVTLASGANSVRGRCLVALSGGSTPRPLYELLATPPYAKHIDWPRMHLFWGDERCVPPDHVGDEACREARPRHLSRGGTRARVRRGRVAAPRRRRGRPRSGRPPGGG